MSISTTDLVFAALGDPTRRDIVDALAGKGAQRISDLAGRFRMSRQAVTKHLNILCEAGIVVTEWRGRERIASLEPRGCDPARTWLARYELFWDTKLKDLKKMIEEGNDHGID